MQIFVNAMLLLAGSISFLMRMFVRSRSDDVKAGDQYTAVYIIRGLSLGRTDIIATAVQHGKKGLMNSDSREIQVCNGIFYANMLTSLSKTYFST